MKVSKAAQKFAKRVIHMCQSGGMLDDEKLSKALAFLRAKQPNDYRAILFALRKLVRLEIEERSAYIESANELDALEKKRISDSLAAQHGSNLLYHYEVNPDLIGGMRVRIGSQVYDGSVRSKINRLANSL